MSIKWNSSFLIKMPNSNSLKPSKDLYKERRSTISMQIQISDLLQLNIESNLQQNLEGSTILECSCSILMHRAIIFLWNESPLLWTHGWLVPCPLQNPPPLHYWGQDWTGLEIEAQIPIFRRFLRKMATFKIFSSEMHRSQLPKSNNKQVLSILIFF